MTKASFMGLTPHRLLTGLTRSSNLITDIGSYYIILEE